MAHISQEVIYDALAESVCHHNNHIMSGCSDCNEEALLEMAEICPECNKTWHEHSHYEDKYCRYKIALIGEEYNDENMHQMRKET